MLANILLGVSITLMYAAPLILTSLGGVISQRAGVDNIGLEGMMTFGAFVAVTVSYFSQSWVLGFLAAGLAGASLALLHGLASITLKGNQTISGVAINFIGLGISIFTTRLLFKGAAQTYSTDYKIPRILSGLGIDTTKSDLLQTVDLNLTIIFAVVATAVVWFVLYRTKLGLRIRACGEHPAAADTLGVNVSRIRYGCVIMSGVMSGFGGAAMSLAVVSLFTATVISGHGFIALAAVIFGNWKPVRAAMACLLFGFAKALTVLFIGNAIIPIQVLEMLPYVLTLTALVFMGRATPPRAIGIPYFKGEA